MATREAPAFQSTDPFLGGQAVWANFSDWLNQVPEGSCGLFSSEAEVAALACFPDVYRGKGKVDEALTNYTPRRTQQIQ